MRIIFLGTGGSVPTESRGLPGIAVKRYGELILFDCGEGTQRQMAKAHLSVSRLTAVFVTHMHGDHILGLPGLFQTMSLLGRKTEFKVFGPSGIDDFVQAITETVRFTLTVPIKVKEASRGVVYNGRGYCVKAVEADHIADSLAYALIEESRPGKFYPDRAVAQDVPEGPLWSKLQRGGTVQLEDGRVIKPEDVIGPPRPGRKIVYSGDTRPSSLVSQLAQGADVLIHESTFDDELMDRASEDGHSTPGQAAAVAKEADVKRLILTHISARYHDSRILHEQARKVFSNVTVAEDLMEIEVSF